MRCVLPVALLTIGVYAVVAAEDSAYGNIDVDEVLSNDRLYQRYILCLKGEGVCTPEGKELKDNLKNLLQSGCSKCTGKQKDGLEKAVKHVFDKKPQDYTALEVIYDPEGIYRSKYQAAK